MHEVKFVFSSLLQDIEHCADCVQVFHLSSLPGRSRAAELLVKEYKFVSLGIFVHYVHRTRTIWLSDWKPLAACLLVSDAASCGTRAATASR